MLYSIVLAFAISSVNQPQVHTCPLPADPPPPHPHRVTEPRLCSLPNGSLVSIAKTHWSSAAAAHAWQECRWYDYFRRSYYDMDACIAELLAQRRSHWDGLDAVYKKFVTDDSGNYAGPGAHPWDAAGITYNDGEELVDVKPSMFTVPFPTEDVVMNPNVASTAAPIHVDVRETFTYDF